MNILCRLGIHKKQEKEEILMQDDVQTVTYIATTCKRCGRNMDAEIFTMLKLIQVKQKDTEIR